MSSANDLDALTAAPHHHRLAFESDSVRVLETKVAPGDTVPLHTHAWGGVLYVLSWSDFVRRDESGSVLLDSKAAGLALRPGDAVPSAPLGLHTLENVGDRPLHIIAFETKDQ
ncbi:MAG: hypothetical protein JSS66_17435 [Armatimonadetes bacterium]|nr:hypothetical protein [Armatimonadota bacterium]